jgi:DNA end-binding protein Ku
LRWGGELRDVKDLDLPADGVKSAGIREKELSMAEQLIEDMTERLKLDKFRDTFRDDILALVKRKVKAGKTEAVETPEAAPETAAPSNVIDLTELLKRSLHGGKASGGNAPAAKVRKRSAPKAKAAPVEKRKRA